MMAPLQLIRGAPPTLVVPLKSDGTPPSLVIDLVGAAIVEVAFRLHKLSISSLTLVWIQMRLYLH